MIAIFPIIFLIFALICFFRESKVTALYKTFGVYGRFSAYITFSLMFGAVASLVGSIIAVFTAGEEINVVTTLLGSVALSTVLFVLGLLLYKRMVNKCPDFLRKKLFISMVTTAMGIAFKIALFFIPVVWALAGPKTVTSESGEDLYIISGDVYDGSGNRIGAVNSDGKSFTRIA